MTAAFAVSAVAVAGALSGGRASAVTGHSFAAFRSAEVAADVSANSAGYALIGSSTTYTSATGTREEPKVTCEASDSSAFWVGLGGADVFVHQSGIAGSGRRKTLIEGATVEYEIVHGDRGAQARKVVQTRS